MVCCGLNYVHQKALLRYKTPGPVNVALAGNRVFVDIINLR